MRSGLRRVLAMKGVVAMQVTLVREPVTHRNVNAQELAEHMIQAGAFEAKFVAMRQVPKTDCCSRSGESAG